MAHYSRDMTHSAAAPSIRARVQDSFDGLSNAERKVARTLLARYPSAGLTTVAELAAEAQVSAPTVLRFAGRLGYSGFQDLQRALIAELNDDGSPLRQYEQKRAVEGKGGVLARTEQTFADALRATYAEIPESEFSAVARLLSDTGRRVLVTGGRFSGLQADYLVRHLQLLRPGVQLLPQEAIARRDAVLSVAASTVLVVYDYRRYSEAGRALAVEMRRRGATVALMTDSWLSPISDTAKHVLPARVDSASPFDSAVAATAITESLVAAVTEVLGDAGMQRVAQFESQAELRGAAGDES